MKKFLSVVLAVAMLIGMVVLPVSAEENAVSIEVDETKTFVLTGNQNKQLQFTPAESGRYILYRPIDSDFTCDFFVCEDDGDWKTIEHEQWHDPGEQFDGSVIDAQAGETYIFLINNNSYNAITCTVSLAVAQAFETFEINCEAFSGYANDILSLSIKTSPEFAFETIPWENTNPEAVQMLYAINGEAQVRLMAPGEATVTARSESGKTASCAITVLEKPAIEAGETVELEIDPGQQKQFHFSPDESGAYVIYYPINTQIGMTVVESETNNPAKGAEEWDSGDGKYCGMHYEFESGATYAIYLFNLSDTGKISTSITLEKMGGYDSIGFKDQEVSAFVGEELILEVETAPASAKEEISWTSSDPDVAAFEFSSDTMAWFKLKKAGTAAVTATSASGKTASCVIHVQEPEMLKLDETVTFTLKPKEYILYSFTASADGVYSVYGKGEQGCCSIFTENESGEWVQPDGQWERDGITGCDFAMSSGETYVFQFYHNGEAEAQFEAMVSHRAVLTGDADGNGEVTILDLMRMANYFANGVEINEANADVNSDGEVTILDLMRLANYFAGNVSFHEHSYTATVTKPTCTAKGYTTYKCKCGDTYKGDEVAAAGHDWGEWEVIKEATTTSAGERSHACNTCHLIVSEEIPKKEKETLDAAALASYGNGYASSLGFTLDSGVRDGYFPPITVSFTTMDAARAYVASAVKGTYNNLMSAHGTIEGCRAWVNVTDNGNGTYTTTVYYG